MINNFIQLLPLKYYALSGLINCIAAVIMCFVVFFTNRESKVNRLFATFSLSVAYWSFFYFMWLTSSDKASAEFYLRSCMIGVLFMPSLFFHFVVSLLNFKINKRSIVLNYLLSIFFATTVYTPLYAKDIGRHLIFPYWLHTGPIFHLALLHFGGLVLYAFYLMWKTIKSEKGAFRNQILYIFTGTVIGYIAGVTNFFSWYRINIPPFLNIFVSIYVVTIAYAIVKYHLMDINLVITRTGIFVLVYSIVLGIPFGVGYVTKSWFVSTGIAALLASGGPFLYQYLKRRSDELLLKEQRRYQNILRQLSASMILIKDMDRLLKLIVYRVAKAIKVEFACIYIADISQNKLLLKFPYTTKGFFPDFPKEMDIVCSCELCAYIKKKRKPVFSEELSDEMKKKFSFRSGIIIPSFVRERLLGFLILGPKVSSVVYTPDDAIAFEVLGNQAAMAIENTEFIQESQKTQAQLFAAERMSSMGAMAGGMSHQINNRFHAILMATSDTLDSLQFINTDACSQEMKDYLKEVRYALERITENAKHGGKIVNDFLNFSQPDRLQKQAKEFKLGEPLERAIEMARIKTAFPQDMIEKLVPDDFPAIQADFVLIQDVFFNIIDNAIDAIKRKEQAIQEKHLAFEGKYKGRIRVTMKKDNGYVIIQIEDNGIGLNDEAKKKMFVPFFTTKATAAKGTGLGLFVIEKIITAHKGKIKIDSEYGQGTSFIISLPITQKKEEE